MNDHSPIVSEFDSPEEQAAYERWLAEKVERSLSDPRPAIPHDEAMGRVRARLKDAKASGNGC